MKGKSFVTIIFICTVLFLGNVMIVQAEEYTYEAKTKNIAFAWKVDGDILAVKISAETKGWVGIGFNPDNKMKGANFILGYVKKGKAKIRDDFGSSKTSHKSDEKLGGLSDVTLVGGTEKDGVTTIEFTIPLKSGDLNDTEINVNSDTVVLLAYGSGRDGFTARHKYRTALKVNLTTGAFQKMK